ncbi:MAG: hypothetical protein Q7U12_03330 [Undibacterium sp.]|nr:hypothetical protein [Undibacterium sp.]
MQLQFPSNHLLQRDGLSPLKERAFFVRDINPKTHKKKLNGHPLSIPYPCLILSRAS